MGTSEIHRVRDVGGGGAGAAPGSPAGEDGGFLEAGLSQQVALLEDLSLPILDCKSSSVSLLAASFRVFTSHPHIPQISFRSIPSVE